MNKAELLLNNLKLNQSLDLLEQNKGEMVDETLKLITKAISTKNPAHINQALSCAFAVIANMYEQQKDMIRLLRESALDMSVVLSDVIDKEDDEDE